MVEAKIKYGAATTDTITLASLATSSTLVTGREGNAVDHSSNNEIDSIVGGKVTTGTTPTAGTQIEIWAAGSYDGTSFSGGATGADAAFTPQDKSLLRLVTVIPISATSNQLYTWGPFSLASVFGGVLPRKTSIVVIHNTAVNLNSTAGTHEVKRTSVNFQSA